MCKHIKIVLPNFPGEASSVIDIIGQEKINILGYALSDTGESGLLCFLCTDHEKALLRLKDRFRNFVSQKEVVVVSIPHEPGQLKRIFSTLSEKRINIRNSYQAFGFDNRVLVVLDFNNDFDLERAQDALESAGSTVLKIQP